MNKEEFYIEVTNTMIKYPQWRYGQTVFNVMYDLFPDRANKYRGSEFDPFYRDDVADMFIDLCFE